MVRAVRAGLIDYEPILAVRPKRRRLMVTPEIKEIFDGTKVVPDYPVSAADRRIGAFVAGHLIAASRVKAKRRKRDGNIDVEQIVNVDEVWAFCWRLPRPGHRFLGRFLEQDTLVLLRHANKFQLVNRYEDEGNLVISDWQTKLTDQQPLRSANLSDYLSGPVYDVDAKTTY